MYCPHCGQPCDETKPFCQNCGSEVNAAYVPPQFLRQNRVWETLRRLASSKLYLTAAITYTATIVLTLIDSFFPDNLVPFLLGYMNTLLPELTDAYAVSYTGNVFSVLPSLLLPILPILLAASIWMMRAAVMKGKRKSAGLTIIKVVFIIKLVLACLGLGLILIMFGLLGFMAAMNEYSADPVTFAGFISFMLGFCIFMLAFFIFFIVYSAKLLKTLKILRQAIGTGEAGWKMPAFIIGWLWVFGVFNALVAVVSLVFSPIYALNCAASAVSFISFALLLKKYKNEMRAIVQSGADAFTTLPVREMPPMTPPTDGNAE